jgi:anti-anti-sigma factor
MATTEVPTLRTDDTFRLTIAFRAGRWRLELAGALDLASGRQLVEVVELVSDRTDGRVEIDMAAIDFIDSAGLHAVATACGTLRGRGMQPAVVGASSPAVVRLLDAMASCGLAIDLGTDAAPARPAV